MKINKKRFDNYLPLGDAGNPETSGLLAHDKDWDFGTPQLDRSENVSCVASNSTLNQCLVLRIKWRPDSNERLVTVISRLTFILDRNVYEFAQVESYEPSSDSCIRPGRIVQYGSSSSKLKLFVMNPYRKTRIVFNGYMRHVSCDSGPVGTEQEPRLVHVKLGCIMLPSSEIFDFYEQFDAGCLKQIYDEKKPSRDFDSILNNLLLHDRHEQRVRLVGEYLMIDNKCAGQPTGRKQGTIEIRGHYNRHFLSSDKESQVRTTRLFALANNGQGFHIGTRRLDSDEIDFGYTAFLSDPMLDFIEKPFKIDAKLDPNLQKFHLTISGQQCTFECTGERHFCEWFKLTMNGKPGWAWLSASDELVDDQEELMAIERSRIDRSSRIDSGELCRPIELSPNQEPLVVSIEDDCCSSSALVGAKAASLAQLHRFVATNDKFTYRVPHAFVLTRFAHDLILKENPKLCDAIEELRQFATRGDLGDLRDECKKIRDLVSASSLPKVIAEELWQRLDGKYQADQGATFAVRSSSWGEDEAEMSAAGQLISVLNVGRNSAELSKAVMECFASKFSCENIEYKRQHGQPLNLPMAVVVQKMISCDRAGVMFTCDPTNGDETVVTITANYGLGESVVSAQADPDSIRVRVDLQPADYSLNTTSGGVRQPSLKIDEIQVGKKELIIGEGQYDKSKCCLNDEEILQLAGCGLEIKRYFWSQCRDIEWGYKSGELYLFQSRPVTGLESFTETELLREFDSGLASELNYFTRANIGEVMPYALKPLTLTFTVAGWKMLGHRLRNGLVQDGIRYVPQTTAEMHQQKYHCMLSCNNSMVLSLEKQTVLSKSMEIGLFGREIGPRPDIVEAARGIPRLRNPFEGTSFKLRTWQLRLMPVRTVEKELTVMLKLREEVRNLKLAVGYESNKLLGLYNQLSATQRYGAQAWSNHISVMVMASSSNVVLSAFLSKYIKDAKQLCAATNRFLAISHDVVSAEIPKRVRKMAQLVRADGLEQAEVFARMQPDEALKHLLNGDSKENKPIREAFEDFMSRFGHRCYNEFELAASPWREDLAKVVDMVQKNCLALINDKEPKEDNRDTTIDEVIKSLQLDLTFKDKFFIKKLIAPKCQLLLSLREKTKNAIILHNDIVRECVRMLASEMVRQQRIPDEDLLYYVAFNELKPLCMDHKPAIVMHAVKRRQLFKKMFDEVWKFDEVFQEVVPNHLKPTKELDEAIAQAPKLLGTPASSGRVQGTLCRVEGYKDLDKVRPGTILLTHSTDIAFSPVFPLISGLITEVGGLVSHGAVVAREYGLPSLIGIPDVMRILQDGEEIILDADNGVIIRLSKSSNSNSVQKD